MIQVIDIQNIYQQELSTLYDKQEVNAIFYRLAEHYHGISRLQIATGHTIQDDCLLLHALDQLKKGKPLQYITGTQHFMELELQVREGVLIPRPETEELVQLILDQHPTQSPLRILDMCTGSGCIALALKHFRPQWEVHACDWSETALQIAQENALQLGLKIHLHHFDLLNDWSAQLPTSFDIFVSNPPYVLPSEASTLHSNVLSYEPHIALFSPEEDGLGFYQRIAHLSEQYQPSTGNIYLEINPLRAFETQGLFKNRSAHIHPDLSGKARFLYL